MQLKFFNFLFIHIFNFLIFFYHFLVFFLIFLSHINYVMMFLCLFCFSFCSVFLFICNIKNRTVFCLLVFISFQNQKKISWTKKASNNRKRLRKYQKAKEELEKFLLTTTKIKKRALRNNSKETRKKKIIKHTQNTHSRLNFNFFRAFLSSLISFYQFLLLISTWNAKKKTTYKKELK